MAASKAAALNSALSTRCPWPGIDDPEYARYHDEEWGVPKLASRELFEKIVLEGFQAGLSWLTILRKRDNFRKAFHHFDPARIARYTGRDITRLMGDAGIVRNRLKIEATIANARAYVALEKEQPFSEFIWGQFGRTPLVNRFDDFSQVPAETPSSKALSKALKGRGFRFVGPTTMYAFMQASGIVNDHLVSCPRHTACADLQKRLSSPENRPVRP